MASSLASLKSPPDTDTVSARLAPHEAVLNVGAAKLMGRKKIDKLNARGRKYQGGTSDVGNDNPPGAPAYERGPLANIAPTPSPTPTPVRKYAGGTSDVKDLDYAENHTGSFGSGWTPGNAQRDPNFSNAALDSLRTPPPPVTAPVAPGASSVAGGFGNTTRVGPVPGAPVSANPNPGAEKVLSGISGAGASDVTVTGARPPAFGATDITAPTSPTGAETAGAKVRSAIGTGVGALKTAASSVGNFFTRSTPQPGAGIGGERADIPAGGEDALSPIAGFARGLAGTGRATAAGVSNASAARIQQPTAANPVPVTDTTPDQHPDESENAITRFGRLPTGLFDNPNTRRKLGYKKTAFAGF